MNYNGIYMFCYDIIRTGLRYTPNNYIEITCYCIMILSKIKEKFYGQL